MHPIFNRRGSLLLYIGLWMALSVLLAGLLQMPGGMGWRNALTIGAPLCLFYAFVCLTPWYVCRYKPLRTTPWFTLIVNHLGAAILATGLWVSFGHMIAAAIGSTGFRPAIPSVMVVGLLLYIVSVALHYALLAVEQSRESEIQAREAELRALKAQINPHFLFNSLNSITALTTVDPARAREMCIRLSDFLRSTLGLGERESISWREELALARVYLDVEQVRFGSRLQVEMNVDEACQDCLVPPLVLQPLIENAVKHGIATLVDGGTIKVEGAMRNGQVEISVENGFDPDSPSPRRHGIGLRNIRSRLETRFGEAATLTAHAENNRFRAEMVVPCRKA
jgi:two-component system, LytTR family, sensor histidine kinase AlgZ